MQSDEALFVIDALPQKRQWHLRCIDCLRLSFAAGQHYRELRFKPLFLAERVISVSTRPAICSTSRVNEGPAAIYSLDKIIKDVPSSQHGSLIIAQNHDVLISDDDCSALSLPCFACTSPTHEVSFRAVVEFATTLVNEFPEVRAAMRQMLARSTTPDLMAMMHGHDHPTPIPVGLYLPARALTGLAASPAVYSVVQWHSERRATIECHVADNSVPLTPGTCLVRPDVISNAKGRMFTICTIEEVL